MCEKFVTLGPGTNVINLLTYRFYSNRGHCGVNFDENVAKGSPLIVTWFVTWYWLWSAVWPKGVQPNVVYFNQQRGALHTIHGHLAVNNTNLGIVMDLGNCGKFRKILEIFTNKGIGLFNFYFFNLIISGYWLRLIFTYMENFIFEVHRGKIKILCFLILKLSQQCYSKFMKTQQVYFYGLN